VSVSAPTLIVDVEIDYYLSLDFRANTENTDRLV